MCDFCKKFDFRRSKIEVDKYGARIVTTCGDYSFPKNERFAFCPVCGETIKYDDYEQR